MKKILLLAAGLTATPLAVVPAVTATVHKNDVNVADVTVKVGNNSSYTVRFKNDRKGWPMYAEIYKMSINEKVEELNIPDVVDTPSGESYPLYRIDTFDRCSGTGVIKKMNFSKATHLHEIAKGCFGKGIGTKLVTCPFMIQSIYWHGASSLTSIGERAFFKQSISNEVDPKGVSFNFLGTAIERFELESFYCCCEYEKNDFEHCVLPPTVKFLGNSAFADEKFSVCADFKYVIFTNTNPDQLTINDSSMPAVRTDIQEGQIIVPHGTLDKFKQKQYFVHSDRAHASAIWYDDQHCGNRQVIGSTHAPGIDTTAGKSWLPFNGTSTIKTATITPYGALIGKHMSVESDTGYLKWDAMGLPKDIYNFYVVATVIDDGGIAHVAISNMCKFALYGVEITNVPQYIEAYPSKADVSKTWSTSVGSPDDRAQHALGFQLRDVPDAIKDKVSVMFFTTQDKGYIKWEEGLPEGTYHFYLQPELTSILGQNRLALPLIPITMIVSDDIHGFGIELWYSTGEGTAKQYDGEIIDYVEGQDLFVYAKDKIGGGTTPQCSSTMITAEYIAETQPWGSKYKITPSTLCDGGTYKFCFFQEQTASGITVPVYSDWVTVRKNGGFGPTLADSDDYITVQKGTQGTTVEIPVCDSKHYVDTVQLVAEDWNGSVEKQAANEIKIEPSTLNKNSVTVYLNNNFFDAAKKTTITWIDLELKAVVKSPNLSLSYHCNKSFSLLVGNSGEIKYGGPNTLYTYADSDGKTFDDKFEYWINGAPYQKLDVAWSATVRGDDTGKYTDKIKLIPSETDNTAQLYCEHLEIPQDQETLELTVDIEATDDQKLTYAVFSINVVAYNNFEITGAPELIEANVGVAGKSATSIKPLFNGKQIEQSLVTYHISGYDVGNVLSIDQDGYINWTNEVVEGEYTLTISAEYTDGVGRVYSSNQEVAFKVVPKPEPGPEPEPGHKTNVGAIVGGAVGGAVVVGGVAAGTTIGIKKHKIKVTKK